MTDPQAPLFVIYRKRLGAIDEWYWGSGLISKAIWTRVRATAATLPMKEAMAIRETHGGTVLPSTEKETK